MDKNMLSQLAQHPWAILPAALTSTLARISAGVPPDVQAATRANVRAGATAIVPIQGVLRQKPASFIDEMFREGGTSYERLGATMRMLAADESIGTIVLDINSPGGSVFGMAEAADAVFKARESKRIVAVANSLAASAAYGIASQAHEIIVTPSGLVGSIGVIAVHEEVSKMAEAMGIGVTVMSAGKFKAEGNMFEPLSDEAKEAIQAELDDYYAQFVGLVARGRGVKASEVKSGYGQGRVATAKESVSLNLADKVGTLIDVLGRSGLASETMAAIADPEITAEADPVDDHAAQIERERWEYAKLGA